MSRWQADGTWSKLQAVKRVFREPREAADLDSVLKAYALTIEGSFPSETGSPRGAMLLSVVGGKMSEGINFSDGLGRCVLMVGLPYANASELTLAERMAFLNTTHGDGAGREYYTNLCMKAVNQSIGRAIRHIGDYATIVLADSRFASAKVRKRLPKWIGDNLKPSASFDHAINMVDAFFLSRSAEQARIEARRLACHLGAKR